MAAIGTPIFDALVLTKVEIDVLRKSMTTTAAFVDTKTGASHGWTKGEGAIWSEATKEAATVLMASLERDMAKQHFGLIQTEAGLVSPHQPTTGLGEHLSDSDGTRSV